MYILVENDIKVKFNSYVLGYMKLFRLIDY